MAAVWMEEPQAAVEQSADYKAILDALPMPVWLRDKAPGAHLGQSCLP